MMRLHWLLRLSALQWELMAQRYQAEAADMVLLVDDVTKVSDAIEIGRRTVQIAKQSIYVGLGASFIFMVIASFGLIPPTIGALLQEVFDVAVILNALRAR